MRPIWWFFVGGAALAVGCAVDTPEAEKSEFPAQWVSDTLLLGAPLNDLKGEVVLESDLAVSGLPFPSDIADLPGDSFAVLDRMDRAIHVLNGAGQPVRTLGRPGDGPGEYDEPYALAAYGALLAVWDKSGRLTVLSSDDGRVLGTTATVGDTRAIWQRLPMSSWEEPLQLSREDVTRRLAWIDGSSVGLLLQDRDERTDEDFLAQTNSRSFSTHVLVFDTLAQLQDTLITLPGQEFFVVPWTVGNRSIRISSESAFPSRPLWTSGQGWTAWASGRDTLATVRFDDGVSRTVIWQRDTRPGGSSLLEEYVRSEIEGHRRLEGDEEADEMEDWPLEAWSEEGVLLLPDSPPQIMGMLGMGPCLVLVGFRPEDGPHGESRTLLFVDIEERAVPVAIQMPVDGSFVRAVQDDAVFTVRVTESGERVVKRYPLPQRICST